MCGEAMHDLSSRTEYLGKSMSLHDWYFRWTNPNVYESRRRYKGTTTKERFAFSKKHLIRGLL
jgi:hypothetical protein